MIAITVRKMAPAKVRRVIVKSRKSAVGLPGLDEGEDLGAGRVGAGEGGHHLRVALGQEAVALGELKLPRSLFGKLVGWMARGGALGPKPFARGLPTSAEFVVKDARDFAREREGLLEVLTLMSRAGPSGITKEPHPFFGKLTPAEWDTLQWKHVDHHLRQFGA